MVQVENSILAKEVNDIITNTKSDKHNVEYDVTIHTVDIDYSVSIVESIEILRDYNVNIADYTVLTCMVPAGDYVKDMHPYKDNMEVTLTRKINGYELKQRFKLVIMNNKGEIEGTRYDNSTREELNKLEMIRIEGQCIDRVSEALRLVYVDGVYRSTDIDKLLKVKFDNGIAPLGFKDNLIVNLIKPDNTREYDHIEVPTGLDLFNLPTYLQNTHYGVYNGNIGTYLQYYNEKTTIFIYPLYNSKRFDTSEKKLMVYGVSSAKFDYVEHTYFKDGDIVKILAGKSTIGINDGEDSFMDSGVGFTNTDPNKIITRNSNVNDDEVTVDTEQMNAGQKFKNKADLGDKTVHLGPVDNMYKHRSDIVKRSMAVYQIQWNHCDPDLIYPGMPVMYVYLKDENTIVKLKGTVQSIFILNNIGTNTVSAMLNIMVEKPNITGE
jgi:hypothetical protein